MAQPFGRGKDNIILSEALHLLAQGAAKDLVVSVINLADADVSLPRRERPLAQHDTLITSPLGMNPAVHTLWESDTGRRSRHRGEPYGSSHRRGRRNEESEG